MNSDPEILAKADVITVDSKSQCIDHGEIHNAFKEKLICDDNLLELGQILANTSLGRTDETQITVSDLTGVSVQDIQIAKALINFTVALI